MVGEYGPDVFILEYTSKIKDQRANLCSLILICTGNRGNYSCEWCFSSLPTILILNHPEREGLLKTLWEKEKTLETKMLFQNGRTENFNVAYLLYKKSFLAQPSSNLQ